MSIELTSNQWIFINYPPGAFGSFLGKVLELSPEVSSPKSKEIFDQYNASHQNIVDWIDCFHDGDELEAWALLPYNEQRQFIIDHIKRDQFYSNTLRKVHRITVPIANNLFRQHFTQAQFIKITVDPDNVDMIAYYMATKTMDHWLNQKVTKNPKLAKILTEVSKEHQLQHYIRECKNRIISIIDNSEEPNTFNFPIASFKNADAFYQEIDKLTDWLNIKPFDSTKLYQEFYHRHKEFNIP